MIKNYINKKMIVLAIVLIGILSLVPVVSAASTVPDNWIQMNMGGYSFSIPDGWKNGGIQENPEYGYDSYIANRDKSTMSVTIFNTESAYEEDYSYYKQRAGKSPVDIIPTEDVKGHEVKQINFKNTIGNHAVMYYFEVQGKHFSLMYPNYSVYEDPLKIIETFY